jgi:anti-sigma regulatory factor (Ser/Thr protein kinase)
MTVSKTGGAQAGERTSPVSLVIPGRAEYVALCRLVAGAVGAQEGVDEETIADLKVMVTEACNCFLDKAHDADGTGPAIKVEFETLPEAVVVTVSDPERRYRPAPLAADDGLSEGALSEGALALTIMKALADEVQQSDTEGGGSVLRLVKRVPPPAGDPS